MEPPQFGRAPIWINGDEAALEQLFLNLLLNAVQETESGGRVSAAVTLDDEAIVTITDTGRGIPQDALDRVFEPFYSTKPDGAGLGLAIAWRTAAAHGGRLTIESAVGRGTTVDVALPFADTGSELRLNG
jgi:signal transduction histidine kinase